ncbi:zinc transporter 6-like isoform X2 [Dysidea avara]|uniref:zinc transporter 6-like isoform X2 n=1 Tax=Dysidea avara TaxID=196820 RepID=UPI0033225D0A
MKDLKVLAVIGRERKSWVVLALLAITIMAACFLFYHCHTSDSLGLTSFTYITMFDIGSLVTCLVSIWVSKQTPSQHYSFGYDRMNVLAVFSNTVLVLLAALTVLKHSMERVMSPPIVNTDNFLLCACIGLGVHILSTWAVTNRPLKYVSEAATPGWLQNVVNDLSHSIPTAVCAKWTRRLDPFLLLAVVASIILLSDKVLVDLDKLYLADVAAAMVITILTCATLLPFSIYTGKILLQTAPEHTLPVLDKYLHEISIMDGVLEIKNEHFWTISFGSLAGSLYIKVKRDADEQEVLHQVTSKLAGHVTHLTVHITKDEWSVSPLGHHGTGAGKIHIPNINNPLLNRLGGAGSVSAARVTKGPAVGNQQSYIIDMSTKLPVASSEPQATTNTASTDNNVVSINEKV